MLSFHKELLELLLVWVLKLRKHQYKLRAHSKAVGRLLKRGGGSLLMSIFKRVLFALISALTLYIGNI